MATYRRDPETAAVFGSGGLIGNRTLDDRRADDLAFTRMVDRRLAEIAPRPVSGLQRDAIEESVWGIGAVVARRMREITGGRTSTLRSAPAPAAPPRRVMHRTPAPTVFSASYAGDGGYRDRGDCGGSRIIRDEGPAHRQARACAQGSDTRRQPGLARQDVSERLEVRRRLTSFGLPLRGASFVGHRGGALLTRTLSETCVWHVSCCACAAELSLSGFPCRISRKS